MLRHAEMRWRWRPRSSITARNRVYFQVFRAIRIRDAKKQMRIGGMVSFE